MKIALSAGLESAVNLGRRCMKDTREDTRAANAKILKEIWKFAKSQDVYKSGPHLANLLEIFTSFTDEKSSVEILNKMGEAPAEAEFNRYSWQSIDSEVKVGGGCSSERRKEAILAAVYAFKWHAGISH